MGDNRDHSWTDERVELLKRLWQDGLSASQIAKELRGVTRNAVIGKAHRLGLTANAGKYRQSASAPHATRPAPKAPTVARAPYQNAGLAFGTRKITPGAGGGNPIENKVAAIRTNLACEPLPERVGELTPTCDLVNLGGHMCRWPIGDPARAGFGFCGRRADDGPYCGPHKKRAYASHAAREWVDKRLAMPTRGQRAA